jgi:hypothetical protein
VTAIYRTGNHRPQNIYRGDAYIGVMFTAEDAALVVEALNAIDPPAPVTVTPKVFHSPELRGSDSLGYGACTTCGDLWPCAAYRRESRP